MMDSVKRRRFLRVVSIVLVVAMMISLSSCGLPDFLRQTLDRSGQSAESEESAAISEQESSEEESASSSESSQEEKQTSSEEQTSKPQESSDTEEHESKPQQESSEEILEEETEESGLTLLLMIQETDIALHSDGEIHYSIKGASSVSETIYLKNDLGEVLAQFEPGADTEGIIKVSTEEEGCSFLYLESGSVKSSAASYYVHEPVTDAMMAVLDSVMDQIESFITSSSFEDPTGQEAIDAIESFLSGVSSVKATARIEDALLFQTSDGLVGAYNLGRSEDDISMGGVSFAKEDLKDLDADEEVQIDDAFESLDKGEDEASLTHAFVVNGSVLTNPNGYFFGSAFSSEGEGRALAIANNGFISVMSSACETLGGTLTTGSLMSFLSGEFTDYGMVVISGHGSTFTRSDKSKLLLLNVGSVGDLGEVEIKFKNQFWCESLSQAQFSADTVRLIYSFDLGKEENKLVRDLYVTSNHMKMAVQNRIFDNAIIYFNVCEGSADTTLIDAFLSRGAACFFGSPGNVVMGYSLAYYESLIDQLLIDHKSIQNVSDLDLQNAEGPVSSLVDHIMKKGMVTGTDGEEVETYLYLPFFIDWYRDKLNVETLQDIEALDPERLHETLSDQFMYLIGEAFKRKGFIERTMISPRFTAAGSATVEGSVMTVKTEVESKAVEGAVVKAYRWLDHAFHLEQTVTTGSDGTFKFDGLPYGLYEFRAERSDILGEDLEVLRTYRHFYICKENVDIKEKPVFLGYCLKGYVMNEDKEAIGGAAVTFEGASGNSFSTGTDEYGTWEIDFLGSETFDVIFEHDEYQTERFIVSDGEDDPVRYVTLKSKDAYVPKHQSIAADRFTTLAVTTEGTVLKTEDPILYGDDLLPVSNVIEVDLYDMTYICLLQDGTVKAEDRRPVVGYFEKNPDWTDIVKVRAGSGMAAGITSDGHVKMVVSPSKKNLTIDIAEITEHWTDIIDLAIGSDFVAGLKKDGTVVLSGKALGDGVILDPSGWTDIIQIFGRGDLLAGLKKDGTVVVTGDASAALLEQVRSFKKVKMISASSDHIAVVFRDGTVAAAGNNDFGQCDIGTWKDIIAVYAGETITIGLRSDGTIVAAGNNDHGQSDITSWKNIAME